MRVASASEAAWVTMTASPASALCEDRADQATQGVTARAGILTDRREAGEACGAGRTDLRQPVEQPGDDGLAALDIGDDLGIDTCLPRCSDDDLLVDELEPELVRDDGPTASPAEPSVGEMQTTR